MKGILLKRNNSWFIEYTTTNGAPNLIEIHPEYVKCYFLDDDAEGSEVEFEFIKEYDKGGVKGITRYAKLIKPKQEVGNDGFLFDAGSTYPPTVPKLGNEDVPKLGYDVREDDVEKLQQNAWDNYEHEEGNLYSTTFRNAFKLGYNTAKENTYSEEQVREAIENVLIANPLVHLSNTTNAIIQSLKQPK